VVPAEFPTFVATFPKATSIMRANSALAEVGKSA
jgi:hypothetical protein